MFTLKQNITVLFLSTTSLPCWMIVVPLSLPVTIQHTVASANGGIPWWRVWTGSSVRLHHVATATANITPCHKVLHMCGILLLANKKTGRIIWCQLRTSPAFTAAFKMKYKWSMVWYQTQHVLIWYEEKWQIHCTLAKKFNLILLKYWIDNFLTKFTIKHLTSSKRHNKNKLVSKSF